MVVVVVNQVRCGGSRGDIDTVADQACCGGSRGSIDAIKCTVVVVVVSTLSWRQVGGAVVVVIVTRGGGGKLRAVRSSTLRQSRLWPLCQSCHKTDCQSAYVLLC